MRSSGGTKYLVATFRQNPHANKTDVNVVRSQKYLSDGAEGALCGTDKHLAFFSQVLHISHNLL